MAKKQNKTEKPAVPTSTDRHLQPKMTLRLSEAHGEALRAIAGVEDRTITAVVLRALRAYAQANGYDWPGLSQKQRD
jgi:hypothetical protein